MTVSSALTFVCLSLAAAVEDVVDDAGGGEEAGDGREVVVCVQVSVGFPILRLSSPSQAVTPNQAVTSTSRPTK